MKKVYRIIVETVTPFNIGTGNKSNGFIKSITIRDRDGKPYIPGSTMKGLIKSNYRCLNNDTEDVFGSGNFIQSKVIVDNLVLEEDYGESHSIIRFGNAIDRYRKIAKESALYSKETVTGKFIGYMSVFDCDNDINENIKLAVKMITSIGSGKNIGFGQVKIDIDEIENNDKGENISEFKYSDNVELTFKSPLLLGGIQRKSNFLETDNVIRGNVVRAAFARIILHNCKEKDVDGVNGEKNWVYYRNRESCRECELKNICKNFSELKFSYFYPEGSEIIPLSAKKCKNNDEHGFVDELIYINDSEAKGECPVCIQLKIENSRLEYAKGLRIKGKSDNEKRKFSIIKKITTKNAINPYTKTSADQMLYTVETIAGFEKENDEEIKLHENHGFKYTGKIEGISNIPQSELKYFSDLRVGGDTTVGLGKCTLAMRENDRTVEKEKIIKLINEFSNRYSIVKSKKRNFAKEKEEDKKYIAIKFIGDCKLNFDLKSGYITTDEYKEIWMNALLKSLKTKNTQTKENVDKVMSEIKVDKVYAEFQDYRGYNMSLCSQDNRDKMQRLVVKGTVIVFSIDVNKKSDCEKNLFECFNEIQGFGEDQNNGFGDFEIYLGGLEDDK